MLAILRQEVQVVFERDPAAKSIMEVLFCYPGLHAIIHHRMAHFSIAAGCFS
jgi:serine O-acetyltransferase